MPWQVDFKKGYKVTLHMIRDLQKPVDYKKAKRIVSGYKREYQAYKSRGRKKGYTNWAVDKGYAKRSKSSCIQ